VLAKVARLIGDADAILITTGAGMGVASGLGTFRGKNAGVWPPLQELKIDFTQMSNPKWFSYPNDEKSRDSINFGWSFWHYRYEAYTKNPPHRGYEILGKWVKNKKYQGFSFTSNIDGHWEASGFDNKCVIECHGTIRFQQCALEQLDRKPDCLNDIWPLTELNLKIDPKNNCALNPLPTCKHCSGPARPNVLMFDDWFWLSNRHDKQAERYGDWIKTLSENKAKLVILEIGAGTAVPTVRYESEKLAKEFYKYGATLIRFNPEDPSVPKTSDSRHISITDDPLECLEKIDKLLSSSTTSSTTSSTSSTTSSTTDSTISS